MSALFAFVHHLAAFTLFAALVTELMLVRGELSPGNARRLLLADGIFGASAGLLLVAGLLRVFHFEKGATYYLHSWPFIAKLSLFIIIGLISIKPTLEFLSWRKALAQGQAPSIDAGKLRQLRMIIHLELVGVVVIILMAVLMAKGIGVML